MKEIPILMSTPMIQAILDERKTETRRIVKKQPHTPGCWIMQGINWLFPNVNPYVKIKCPYGSIGDVLWVRETWAKISVPDGTTARKILTEYKADNKVWHDQIKWKPSIFMPRVACRIRLEVTDIRAERLHSITEEGAIAEGIESKNGVYKDYLSGEFYRKPKQSYLTLWESINGKGSWIKNDWVWVIKFKKL